MIDQKKAPESIEQTKKNESIDPIKDPKYWKAMERRNVRIAKAIKKRLRSTSNFMYELAQSEVTIYGLPFAEKQARFCLDGTSLSFVLQLKDEEDMRYAESKEKEYDSLRVITKHGHYLIPKAYVYSSGKIEVDVVCHVRFFQLLNFEWHKENVRRETWKAKRFERKKRERKKRERKKRNWRWKRGLKEKKYYYRFILPITSNVMNFVRCYLQYTPTHIDKLGDLIEIPFSEEKKIHVYPLDGYLVIESRFPCTYNEMLDYTYAVSLSLGLVTTIAPFDYAFIIASEMPDFGGKIMGGMLKLRPKIKSQYRFITTQLKILYESLKGKADYTLHQLRDKNGKVKDRLDPMTEQEFSGLVSMLHRSKDLARATMMLLVASNDIEYLGPLYSVVLETVTFVITKEKKKLFSDYTDDTGKKRDIYNNEKLKDPFERIQQIGYELSGIEKQIIISRNKYLHGTLPERGENIDELLYNCMELRKLCGILLLRYSGYKGPILNNAVEMGLEEALKNKEPLFITYDEEAAKELVEKRKNEKQKEKEKKKKRSQSKNNKQSQGKNNTRNQGKNNKQSQGKNNTRNQGKNNKQGQGKNNTQNQDKNNTRNQGKDNKQSQGKKKASQPMEEPEASV